MEKFNLDRLAAEMQPMEKAEQTATIGGDYYTIRRLVNIWIMSARVIKFELSMQQHFIPSDALMNPT